MTMDYTYIEQLLERYFECETSLGEEQVLRAFFAQDNVPVRLLPYRELFNEAARGAAEETLGSDFDKKVLALIDDSEADTLHVKARTVTMQRRLRPLYKAAACVAVVLALGQAAQMPYRDSAEEQQNIANEMKRPAVQQEQNAVAKTDSAATKPEKALPM